jgi:hypothetical protein
VQTISPTIVRTAALVSVLLLARASSGGFGATDLQCHKLKDSLEKTTYTLDASAGLGGIPASTGAS